MTQTLVNDLKSNGMTITLAFSKFRAIEQRRQHSPNCTMASSDDRLSMTYSNASHGDGLVFRRTEHLMQIMETNTLCVARGM
jgi:hypothetical protein